MPSSLKTVSKGLILITWCVIICEAGILPDFLHPALSLPTLPNPFEKGWYLPDFGKIWIFWTNDVPKTASSFLSNLVPKPIKNLFNFDPAPNWVPDPDEFNEDEDEDEDEDKDEENKETNYQNSTDLSGEGSENRDISESYNSSSRRFIKIFNKKEIQKHNKEKGNLQGLGRNIVKSLTDTITNVVDTVTFRKPTGLDTNKSFFSGILGDFKDRVKAIYPGTQWCGDGNTARSKKDLGFFHSTDSCCRAHDNCFDFIEKDTVKHDLYNSGLFTRSNCECDTEFYKCLKKSTDMIAVQIGTAYFTVLGPQCFKKEYPILHCRIEVGLTKRCLEYELDNTTEKIYQWFDNPEY